MQWIVLILALLLPQPLFASEQYSTYQCDNLRDRIEFLRKRTSSGYDVAASSASSPRDGDLVAEYSAHCQHPVDTVRVVRGAINPSPASDYQYDSLENMPSFSANNATFSGEKADAWADFYQLPQQCRQKKPTDDVFVFCAENKIKQRNEFERVWQSNAAEVSTPVAQLEVATMQEYPQPRQAEVSHSVIASTSTAAEQSTLSYLQALDEQNQRFKWYGILILALMATAGFLAWRR